MVDEHLHGDNALIFPFIAVITGLLLDEVNKKVKCINIPDSVLQFMFALLSSALICLFLPKDMVKYLDSLTWTNFEPNKILLVRPFVFHSPIQILLPPLIFDSSFKINSHTFFAKLWFIVSLTVFLYVITWTISCSLLLTLMYIVNNAKYSVVFIFIAIIVATDPVAVVSMLEQYGAPHRLRIMIEGESLLNDGLALMAYRMLQKFMILETNEDRTWSMEKDEIIWELVYGSLMCLVVTPVLAVCLAWLSAWFVTKLETNKARQGFIIVAVYGGFFLFDHMQGSSALGLVFFGVTLCNFKEDLGPQTTEGVLKLWETLAYCANNVIFIFSGYTVGREIFNINAFEDFMNIERMDVFILIEGALIYIIPLFARIMAVVLFYKLYDIIEYQRAKREFNIKNSTRKEKKILDYHGKPKSDFVLLSYAGLRGALGLILSLELRKVKEFQLESGARQTELILLMTCATTVACLVIQGMTFSSIAQREGTTKRSRYVRDSHIKISVLFKSWMKSSQAKVQSEHSSYLHGARWSTVEETLKKIFRVNEQKMKEELRNSDDLDDDDLWEGLDYEGDFGPARAKRVKKRNESDAKVGLYSILLAKVRESWRVGMVSGQTCHVIVSLLEHGIDEGSINNKAVIDHLKHVDAHPVLHYITAIAKGIHASLRANRWIDFAGGLAGNPMFHDQENPDIFMNRGFEKWWIFHSLLILGLNIFLGFALFTTENYRYYAPVFYILLFLATLIEFSYNITLQRIRQQEIAKHVIDQFLGATYWDVLKAKNVLFAFMNTLLITFGTSLVLWLQFHEQRICMRAREISNPQESEYSAFLCSVLSILYRLSRAIPMTILVLREELCMREMRTERVRLAVLIYLTYFMKGMDLPRELFSPESYQIIRRETREFTKIVDANLRAELKEHSAELDLFSLIKTRQAIRMMAFLLKKKVDEMRTLGLVAEDVEERWDSIVMEIYNTADKLLNTPELDYEFVLVLSKRENCSNWLERLTWFENLSEENMRELKNILVKDLSAATAQVYQRGEQIHLRGRRIAFVKKGICKVIEGRLGGSSHNFYVHQGEIMGPRNFLLLQMNSKEKSKRVWPQFLPCRRYIANTRVEICFLEETTLSAALKVPDVYGTVARYVQRKRLVAEMLHYDPTQDLTVENCLDKRRFKSFIRATKETLVSIRENQVAFIGCWTHLVAVRPLTSLMNDKKEEGNPLNTCHIAGPAQFIVAPVDNETEALVYMVPRKFDRDICTDNSNFEKSNYSIMDQKKLRLQSAQVDNV